jgi:hypothetical protein
LTRRIAPFRRVARPGPDGANRIVRLEPKSPIAPVEESFVDAAPVDVPAGRTRGSRFTRRIAGIAAAAAAVSLVTSCAAGQHAQTALEKPTPQDFAYANVGSLHLRAVAVQAPDHVTSGATSYPSGAAVPLTLTIVNSGGSADTLRNITSPAFSGWGVYQTAQIVTAASGSTSSSASSTPSSSTATTATLSPSASPTSASPSIGSPTATSVSLPPQESVQLGIVNQTGSDTRTGADVSAQTVVMTGLHGSKYAPLFPATVVPITFDFAHNGSATLVVPVQLTAPSPGVTVPTLETIANGD